MPDDRAVFENVPSSIQQPKSACCVPFGGVWRKPLDILRERARLMSWDCVMLVGLLKAWGKRFLFLLDNMALVLGAWKGRSSAPSLNHTHREVCVISLATVTIPVCRCIASETNPADEPSRSKPYRPRMHSDVDQCETSTTGLTPDFAEVARVAGEEVQSRKPSRVRSSAGATYTSQGKTNTCPKMTRRRIMWAAPTANPVLCYAVTLTEFLAC